MPSKRPLSKEQETSQYWENVKRKFLKSDSTLYGYAIDHNVNFEELNKKATSENWVKERQKLKTSINMANHANFLAQQTQYFNNINQLSEMLLSEIADLFRNKDPEQPLAPKAIESLTRSLTNLQGIGLNNHTEISASITHLIEVGVLPPDLYPQIVNAVDSNEKLLLESLNRVFVGDCPD